MKKKIYCFTHYDLDGLVSALVVKWAHPNHEWKFQPTTPQNFRKDFTLWLTKNDPDDFDYVYFTDLDLSDNIDLVDFRNAMIIDHHHTHVESSQEVFANGTIDAYINATVFIDDYSSAARLCHKIFTKDLDREYKPTTAQKHLILLADDYDSYRKELKESSMLNTIFWQTQDKFNKLPKMLDSGFKGFTKEQKKMYKLYEADMRQTLRDLVYFANPKVTLDGKERFVVAVFASKHINDVADHLIDDCGTDVAIIVNKHSNHVSWRRGENSDVDLGMVAKDLTNGGGHAYAAGGEITDKFLLFTKKLRQRKRVPINANNTD